MHIMVFKLLFYQQFCYKTTFKAQIYSDSDQVIALTNTVISEDVHDQGAKGPWADSLCSACPRADIC